MSLDDIKVNYVDTADEAAAFKRWLSERNRVAVDTETTGLEWTARVRLCQVGDGETAWVIPVEMPVSWAGLLHDTIGRYEGEVIFHNAPFDLPRIERTCGIRFKRHLVHDVMLQSRVLEPHKSAALKRLSSRHVDPRAQTMQAVLDDAMSGGTTWETVPLTFEPYWFYGGVDAILTFLSYEALEPLVNATAPAAYQLERDVIHPCMNMRKHGVLIDDTAARQSHDILDHYVKDAEQWCKTNYGFGPGSDAKVIEALQQQTGYEFTKLTPSERAYALDKEVLTDVIETTGHPLASVVLNRRRAQKVVSTYLRHFIEDVDSEGRLHPEINTCLAKTSRMSMSDPNLQNLPRKSGVNPAADLVRRCIVPAPGHVLLMCDFDQIEFRIFSSLTPGEDLIRVFDSEDVFAEMSRQMYSDSSITKADPRRQRMKNSVYTRLFGGGTAKFAITADIPFSEAEYFTALLDHRYPEMRQLQDHIVAMGHHRKQTEGEAYVTSPLTARRFINDDDRVYALVNYMIQGTACEVLKMKILELEQAGLGEYMVIPVHDEVIIEVPEEMALDAARTMYAVMNDSQLFRVPITASVSRGSAWGLKEDWDVV